MILSAFSAAERQDAKKARAHFQRAMAAARPQERMYIAAVGRTRRWRSAERRADDYRRGGRAAWRW